MSKVEIIEHPNTLAARIGPRARVFTAALIKQAEQALAKVAERFGGWLNDDIATAERAVALIGEAGEGRLADAIRSARQLRNSGSVFGYPIISRIGASLCQLLEGVGPNDVVAHKLAAAHIDAIRAAARDHVKTEDDPVAAATCRELESQTGAYLAGLSG